MKGVKAQTLQFHRLKIPVCESSYYFSDNITNIKLLQNKINFTAIE